MGILWHTTITCFFVKWKWKKTLCVNHVYQTVCDLGSGPKLLAGYIFSLYIGNQQ